MTGVPMNTPVPTVPDLGWLDLTIFQLYHGVKVICIQ